MKKPESLNTITVGETRKQYRKNQKSLNNILLLVSSGSMPEIHKIASESITSQILTEIILQQEYIRERERANWGWRKEDIDFSKSDDCVL